MIMEEHHFLIRLNLTPRNQMSSRLNYIFRYDVSVGCIINDITRMLLKKDECSYDKLFENIQMNRSYNTLSEIG